MLIWIEKTFLKLRNIEWNEIVICNFTNVFTATDNQFNAYLENNSISNFLQKHFIMIVKFWIFPSMPKVPEIVQFPVDF